MLKTTRTRLTLTTLERRETPARFTPISDPAELVAIYETAAPLKVGEKSEMIRIGAVAEQADAPRVESAAAQHNVTSFTKPPYRDTGLPVAIKEEMVSAFKGVLELAKE